MPDKLTIEHIKAEAKKFRYSIETDVYINNSTEIPMRCPKGDLFWMAWYSFHNGRRCPKCFGTPKKTIEEIRSYIESKDYKLLSDEYDNCYTKLTVKCPKGDEYQVTWNDFQQGCRCPECSPNKKRTIEEVKKAMAEKGITILTDEYKNNHTEMLAICKRGHKFPIRWNDFQQGHDKCPTCNNENRSGSNSHLWKGGVRELNIPLYDTHAHKIEFCEEVRRDPDNKDWLQVRCTNNECNKWFMPKTTQVYNRVYSINHINQGENRFYCSEECKHSCSLYGQVMYPKGFAKDNGYRPDHNEWAVMVKERDSYECQRCGAVENLIAHHIEGLNVNPIESADIDIGITLCKKCDKKAHSEIGCRPIDLHKQNICGGDINEKSTS